MQHLSPITGKWRTCHATKRACRYMNSAHRDDDMEVRKNLYAATVAHAARKQAEAEAVYRATLRPFGEVTLLDNNSKTVTVKIAGEGYSGKRCHQCKYYFTEKEVEQIHAIDGTNRFFCPACHTEARWTDLPPYIVEVSVEDAKLLHDTKKAKETVWYHATLRNDWENEAAAAGVYIHAGSESAARDRMLNDYPGKDFFLYELRIKQEAKIGSPTWDDNRFPEKIGKELQHGKSPINANAVNLYVNQWEAPGSISVIGTLDNFTVTAMQKMDGIKRSKENQQPTFSVAWTY